MKEATLGCGLGILLFMLERKKTVTKLFLLYVSARKWVLPFERKQIPRVGVRV